MATMTTRRERRRASRQDQRDDSEVLIEPNLNAMSIDEAVSYLVQTYGTSESNARFMISVERGIVDGCCIEVADEEFEDGTGLVRTKDPDRLSD
jgi:hypothetical protein